MLSSDIHVRSDDYKSLSATDVQKRKRKDVVSLSLSVPSSKRLFLCPMSDDELDACHEDHASTEGVFCVASGTSQKEQCLHQRKFILNSAVHRRLSDSSIESRGSVDSGVELDSTTGCNRSPCTPVSCSKQVGQNLTDVKNIHRPTCRFQAELAQDDVYVRRLASLNAQACVSALLASKPRGQMKCLISDYTFNTATKNLLETEQKHIEEGMLLDELVRDAEYRIDNGANDHQKESIKLSNDDHGNLPLVEPPSIVPIGFKNVMDIVERLKTTPNVPLTKPRRGDNRWSCYGDPIREFHYRNPRTSDSVVRKYYVGIKRKEEQIFVRDCILVKGSSARKPYIAKVASFWKEKGGIMMTLFWYYRPDDVHDLGVKDFMEGELLASEHNDENTVACIEEKCYVIGLSQYCRFKALKRRGEDSLGLPGASAILPKSVEDFSVKEHWLPSSDTDSSIVFLCYRGYNHLTGRLLKLGPSK